MHKLLQIVYVLLVTFLTAVTTMNIKAALFTNDNGWDGIAAMLGGLMIGALLGLIGGVYSLKWIKPEKLKASIMIVLILNLLMVGIVYLRAEKRKVKSVKLERNIAHTPKYIGIFSVNFEFNKVIHFYSIHYHERKQNIKVIDSFAINENAMELKYAPPYFVPYYSKTDYQILQFKVKSLQKNYVEVVVNESNGQTFFVSLDDGIFENWPAYLLSGNSIDIIEEGVVLYNKPLDYSDQHAIPENEILKVISVRSQWIQVESSSGKRVWLKWYNEDGELNVQINYFS